MIEHDLPRSLVAHWLWSIPPHNYQRCVESSTFAVRVAGKGAMQQVRPGDIIFAYLPGDSVIAGSFRATSSHFSSDAILWPDGIFPHRLKVEPITLLPTEGRLPLDLFKTRLEVGQRYPNFGLVIQKVVHAISEADAAILSALVAERVVGNVAPPATQLAPPRHLPASSEVENERLVETVANSGSIFSELHRSQQKVGLLERKVHDLEQLLALAGPNLEDYLRLAHSSQGAAFEEATRKCFIALGFSLDQEFQGQPGEIDFVATTPFYIFGECQASGSQNVGVSIVDKLLRHRRRYLTEKSIAPPSDDCRLVISEFATAQLNQDARSESVAILRPSQLAGLLKLKREFPGAVNPFNLHSVFSERGDISDAVVRFIDLTRGEIEKRVGIIEVLKNDRFRPATRSGARDAGWIQARLEAELETHIPVDIVEDILRELTSPLIGCVGVDTSNPGRYFYIRDYDFQVASVGPRVEHSRM